MRPLLAGWVLLGFWMPHIAAEESTIRDLDALRRLSRPAIEARPAASLEGVVTGRVPGGGIFLQQGSVGIEVAEHPMVNGLGRGRRVRVDGVVAADGHGLRLVPSRVESLGEPGVPEALRTPGKGIKDGLHHGARLSIEGLVTATTPVAGEPADGMPEGMMVLDCEGEWVTVVIQRRRPALALPRMQGTRVRVEGIARPFRNPSGQIVDTDVLVTPEDLVVATKSTAPDAIPWRRITDLRREANDAAGEGAVQIQGVVTAMLSERSGLVQDDTGGILFRTITPVRCRPGERVQMAGTTRVEIKRSDARGIVASAIVFEAHDVRSQGPQGLPSAERVTHADLEKAQLLFRRISIEGSVLSASRLADASHFRLSIQCGPHLVDVTGKDARTHLPLPAAGSVVRVEGGLDRREQPDTDFQPFRLYVAGLDDVALMRRPPRDRTRALSWGLGVVAALGLSTTGWAFALRRGVRLRTADLAAANEALALANRARGDFLAHMSHEVRTPVHAMLGLLQLLARQPLSAEPMAMVRRLATAGRSLVSIVNDALDLSKIDAGVLSLEAQPFRPNAVLVHLEELFAARAAEKGIGWSVERVPDHADQPVVGDRFRLQQVLGNLASNAIKFTARGHVRVKARAIPSPDGNRMTLGFTVEDTGPGIASDALARLFQPYAQARPQADARLGGTGLGLFISRRLAGLMGGRVHATSTPGVGSAFTMEVELALAAEDGATTEAPKGVSSGRPPGRRLEGCRVLVADDHPLNLGIIEAAIGMEGGCALLVSDGRKAVDAFEREPRGFDAIVMDVQMPCMDGLEAARRIRSMEGGAALPLILCSAGIRRAQREAAMAAGASGYLPKPFDIEDLVVALVDAIQPGPLDDEEAAAMGASGAVETVASHGSAVPFPAVRGIHSAEAERRFGGNLPLFLRSLGAFHVEFEGWAAGLKADVAAGRASAARRRLHGMRGAACMLGAAALASLAAELESMASENEEGTPMDWERFGPVVSELERMLDAIRGLDPEAGAADGSS